MLHSYPNQIGEVEKMKKLVAILFVMAILSGCSTVEGFGKDMQKLGDKIEDAAEKATN